MRIEGSLTMDRAAYRRTVTAGANRLWLSRVLGALIVVCGGTATALSPDPTSVLLVLAGILILLSPEIIVLIGWRRLGRAADRTFHYTVTDGSIAIHTPLTAVDLLWSGVLRVRTTPHTWVIRTATGRSVPIPRAAFAPDAQAQIDAFISAAPFPRVPSSTA